MCGGGSDKVEVTEEEKALAEVALAKHEFAKENLNPLMDNYMAKTDAMQSEAAYGYTRGRVNEGAQVQQAGQREQVAESTRAAGLDPSSGRAALIGREVDNAQAKSKGEATGRATMEQTNQHVKGIQTINAIGAGQSAQAQAGLGQIASQANNEAIGDAYNTFNRNSANMQLVGNVAGAAAHYGMNRPDPSNGTGHGIEPGTGPLALKHNPNVKKPTMFDFSSSDYGL